MGCDLIKVGGGCRNREADEFLNVFSFLFTLDLNMGWLLLLSHLSLQLV